MSSGDDKLPHTIDGVDGDADFVEHWKLEFVIRCNCVDDSQMTLCETSLNMMSDTVSMDEVSLLGEKC